MGDALLWIVGILVVGYIVWNWMVVPGLVTGFKNFQTNINRDPRLKADFKQLATDLKRPPPPPPAPVIHHPKANYGYYYY